MKWMFGASPPPNLLNDDGSASMATALMTSHYAFRRDLARFTTALASLDPSRVEAVREEWRSYHEHLHGHMSRRTPVSSRACASPSAT